MRITLIFLGMISLSKAGNIPNLEMLHQNVTVTLESEQDGNHGPCASIESVKTIQSNIRALNSQLHRLEEWHEICTMAAKKELGMYSELNKKVGELKNRVSALEEKVKEQSLEIEELRDLVDVYETELVVPSIQRNSETGNGTHFVYNQKD